MNKHHFSWLAVAVAAGLLLGWHGHSTQAQSVGRQARIATMLNVRKPDNKQFTFLSANCAVESSESRMRCAFYQASLDARSGEDSCVVTTFGFERTFRKDTEARWISEPGQTDDRCIEVLTLLRSGVPDHWDMTWERTPTPRINPLVCPATVETFTWNNFHVALPCRFARLSE